MNVDTWCGLVSSRLCGESFRHQGTKNIKPHEDLKTHWPQVQPVPSRGVFDSFVASITERPALRMLVTSVSVLRLNTKKGKLLNYQGYYCAGEIFRCEA